VIEAITQRSEPQIAFLIEEYVRHRRCCVALVGIEGAKAGAIHKTQPSILMTCPYAAGGILGNSGYVFVGKAIGHGKAPVVFTIISKESSTGSEPYKSVAVLEDGVYGNGFIFLQEEIRLKEWNLTKSRKAQCAKHEK
jgi:hypothetical protein